MQQSQLIVANRLATRLHDPNWRVVDCRFDLGDPAEGHRQYLSGHIPGAVFADLNRDLAGPITADSGRHPLPGLADITATFSRLGIDESTSVVVYDGGNGAMAARCWWLLRWLGHDAVRLLDGGLAAWVGEGRSLHTGEETVGARSFNPRARPELVVSCDELAQNLADIAGMNLIDARDTPRFAGVSEPIDPVAGHVPGARNLPLTQSIGPDGRWKQRTELEALWEATLGPDRNAAWVAMCGSGVTACHLALSALEAGFTEPRVYVGSWSEWIRDSNRPVAGGET